MSLKEIEKNEYDDYNDSAAYSSDWEQVRTPQPKTEKNVFAVATFEVCESFLCRRSRKTYYYVGLL